MCGSYSISAQTQQNIKARYSFTGFQCRSGDIVPGDRALVLKAHEKAIVSTSMHWGMNRVINARAESVLIKPMFRSGIRSGRIVVPAASFYEWDALKNKVTFSRNDESLLYLAGISDRRGFVILTTQANDSIKDVHDRMPLIIEKEDIYTWLFGDYEKLLDRVPVSLRSDQTFKQETLF